MSIDLTHHDGNSKRKCHKTKGLTSRPMLCACLYISVHVFAVICQTTTWHDQNEIYSFSPCREHTRSSHNNPSPIWPEPLERRLYDRKFRFRYHSRRTCVLSHINLRTFSVSWLSCAATNANRLNGTPLYQITIFNVRPLSSWAFLSPVHVEWYDFN